MESNESTTQTKTGLITRWSGQIKAFPGKLKDKVIDVATKTKKIGQDDPRKIVHSLKVGLALTLVSMFYYCKPLYDAFGEAGMWAVLTVVLVFEFTVGATLSKGINRGFATFVAGALGVGVERLARLLGEKGEPILLGFSVFLLVAVSTFTRFFPHIKARYDYGVMIFILTFSLVAVSGYRDDNILEVAHQRLSTILIGGAICIISLFICPVWAGEDLHKLLALNVEKLGSFLEGFGGEYFKLSEEGDTAVVSKEDKKFMQDYKTVLNTKATEESLANFASWEPFHGRFRFRHPWKQYLKIGVLARQCAYKIEALNGCIDSDVQPTKSTYITFRQKIEEPCTKMSSESGRALKELASTIKKMKSPSSANVHVENSKIAVDEFKSVLEAASLIEKEDVLEIIPAATVASILMDITECVEKIAESINELSNLAHFDSPFMSRTIKPCSDGTAGAHVVITVSGESPEEGDFSNSKEEPTCQTKRT